MRLIHLTDPHLSSLEGLSFFKLQGKRRSGYLSWRQKRRHVHRRAILDRLTREIKAHQPDQVLLTGDLVHIGLEREMKEAAEWLRGLGPPEKIMFVPGNHDNYAADSLQAMYRHWGAYLPNGHQPKSDYTEGFPIVRRSAGVKLIGVNTSCVTPIFSATGKLGEAQRLRLTRTLNADPEALDFRCLLIHHPPFPGMTKRRKALRDATELRKIVSENPPDLVLYGHIHCNRETAPDGVRSYCTASASSIENASYRIFDVEKDGTGWHCKMRLMSLDDSGGPQTPFRLCAESSWHA